MAASTLKKITTRAKAIRKKKPGIKWVTAVKQAGAEYRKKGKPRKKSAKKKRPARKTTRRRKKTVGARVGRVSGQPTVAQLKRAAKDLLEVRLGKNLVSIEKAKGVRAKKKLQKVKAKIKKELRGLGC